MYSASDILKHGENMIFIDQYYFEGDSLIATPRVNGLWSAPVIPSGIFMESACQTGEILCRSSVENIEKIYLIGIKNFTYHRFQLNDFKKVRYKTSLSRKVSSYFETNIEIYFEDKPIDEFGCVHYFTTR